MVQTKWKETLFVVFVVAILANLASCDWAAPGPQSTVIIDYRSTSINAERLVGPSADGVYDVELYGELVATLTPSQFVLPLLSVVLFDHTLGTFEDPDFHLHRIDYTTGPDERFYADFLSDTPLLYEPEIVPGVYDGLFVYIPDSPGLITYGQSNGPAFEWNPAAQIEVILPAEYESVELGMVADWANETGDPNAREVNKDGRSVATNAFGTLMGDTSPFLYIFGNTDQAELYNSSAEEINPGEIFQAASLPSATNAPIIRVPFEQIEIPSDGFGELTVIVSFDLEGLVQLYDNATSDLSDDILIIAPEFWSRISVTIEMK